MTCRLDVEDLIELIVDVVDQVALEDLGQLDDIFADRAIDVPEVLIDDFLVDLELVLEVLEKLLVPLVDGRHHQLESRRPFLEVVAGLDPLELVRPLLRYHVEF